MDTVRRSQIATKLSALAKSLSDQPLESLGDKVQKSFFSQLSSLKLTENDRDLVTTRLVYPIERQIFRQCFEKISLLVEPLRILRKKEHVLSTIQSKLRVGTEAYSPTKNTRTRLKEEIFTLRQVCDEGNLYAYEESLRELEDFVEQTDSIRMLFFLANTRKHAFYLRFNDAIKQMKLGKPVTILEAFRAKS